MEAEWVKVYETGFPYEAEMIKGFLEENDIKSIVVNMQDSAYLIGEAELYVTTEDAFRAHQLILEYKGE
jgi:hypothetical protein